jgi:hypothetical protein
MLTRPCNHYARRRNQFLPPLAFCFGSFLSLWGCLLVGCIKSADSVGASQSRSFQSADAETKSTWDTALSALKTNGYAVAFIAIRKLREQTNLTPDQVRSLDKTATALSDQLYAAANKGDTAAVNALQELRELQRR